MTLLTKYARNAFAEQMDRSKQGKERFGIINMSGLISLYPIPNVSNCSGTKKYEDTLIRTFEKSYFERNIDTLIVQPGPVETGLIDNLTIPGVSCLPEATVRGALGNLGLLNTCNGAT